MDLFEAAVRGQSGGDRGARDRGQLGDSEGVRRRPPARLEALKAKRRSLPSKAEIGEKIRLAEERRKVRVCVCLCVCHYVPQLILSQLLIQGSNRCLSLKTIGF